MPGQKPLLVNDRPCRAGLAPLKVPTPRWIGGGAGLGSERCFLIVIVDRGRHPHRKAFDDAFGRGGAASAQRPNARRDWFGGADPQVLSNKLWFCWTRAPSAEPTHTTAPDVRCLRGIPARLQRMRLEPRPRLLRERGGRNWACCSRPDDRRLPGRPPRLRAESHVLRRSRRTCASARSSGWLAHVPALRGSTAPRQGPAPTGRSTARGAGRERMPFR